MKPEKFIDIEKVLADKNPGLSKRLPKFLVNYLKRIIHEDDINQILLENKDVHNTEFCEDIINRWNIKLNVQGLDRIPKEGKVIIACNHPLGGMDALALVTCLKHTRTDLRFIVNDILMNLDNLKGMFVGVNKVKGQGKTPREQVNQLFASDNAVMIFPAGMVSRKKKGVIEDPVWKKTFISQSKMHGTPIIPVNLDGELSNFFYNLSNLRTFLGIKVNIEMLYLANELYKQKGKTINIKFGEAIMPSTFDNSKNEREWSQWVKEQAYSLKDE